MSVQTTPTPIWKRLGLGLLALVTWTACQPAPHEAQEELATLQQGLSTPTGSLIQGRQEFTTTVLRDGRVLVTGGDGSTTTAELYDVATGRFSPTGPLTVARRRHNATLLNNGKVLITGGRDATGYYGIANAELFDPATNTFSATGSLSTPRVNHTATLLANGRVLVTGGEASSSSVPTQSSCEIYDPATGTWSPAAPLSIRREQHSAVRLPDGKVLVTGSPSTAPASDELYDPATNTWSALTHSLTPNRIGHTSFVLPNGKVLVFGGIVYSAQGASSTSAHLYDPAAGTWSSTGPLRYDRLSYQAIQLADGRVLISGGSITGGFYTSSVERYDPATGLWTSVDAMSEARALHGMAQLPTGRVLTLGGSSRSSGASSNTTELHDMSTTCVPWTCAASARVCGTMSDGCGGTLSCGGCGSGQVCAATGTCAPANVALHDSARKVPACYGATASCDSGSLLDGRGPVGPERNQPNTLDGCTDGTGTPYHGSESMDRLKVSTLDGSNLAAGKSVRIEATVWALSAYSQDRLELYQTQNVSSPSWTLIATLQPSMAGANTLSTTYTLPNAPLQAVRAVFRRWDGASTAPCMVGSWNDHDDLVFAVAASPDSLAPTVSFTAPSSGAYVRGITTLGASASDNVGVKQVEFYAGSTLVGTDVSAPFSVSWNSRGVGNGNQMLTAMAYDMAGNTSSTTRWVYVDNDWTPPTVSISAPANGATVSGSVTVTVQSSDNWGVARMNLLVDGVSFRTVDSPSSTYSFTWDSSPYSNGSHVLSVRAYDSENPPSIASVTVTSANDKTPPTVSLTSPASGSTVSGPVTLSADATDDVGVTRVDFYVGSSLVGTDTTAPFSASWNNGSQPDGSYSLTARAYDTNGNSATSAPITVTLAKEQTPPTVSLTSPVSGSTVSGLVTLSADAADNVGVTQVRFYLGINQVGSDTTAPFSVSFNSASWPNGSYNLTARAYDAVGNNTTSAPITVTLANDQTPPTVSLTSPASGASVSGLVTLSADVTDNVGVTRVEFYAGISLVGADTTAPFSASWNSDSVAAGSYSVRAKAFDAAGNSTTAEVWVSVDDTTPPVVSITSPAQGAVITGSTTLTASATDNRGVVSRVEYYVNGELYGTVYTEPYALEWNTASLSPGSYILQARAVDAAGRGGLSAVVNVTVSTSSPSGNTLSYSVSNTSSATMNTVTQSLALTAGQQLTLGTCGVTGATANGDTYLRLYDPNGLEVAANDDACGGVGSNITYTVPTTGNYQLHAGCFSSNSCGGTVAWTVQ